MAKKKEKKVEYTPFEQKEGLKKLIFYVVIVDFGQGDNISRIFKANKVSAQFIQTGEGTATNKVRDILNIDDTRKEVVFTLIREDYVSELQKELEAYFAISKKNRGVGFAIDLDSFMGVKLYKFFTQTVRG